ncbi:MAG: isoprenylcysteine carboxylmethyltransferase family protein [Xanthomonadales bacterium]|nr:isoprenylcysteine carboxylmethyltransferase family protein [Gammaproteobacteria bacterium]MBT8053613.1 isoprenylcysteine carboxylmethyltransferase family protein [Gammaproteobacteria bacterium]NND58609.1 isoprenylcysteine carboxylmethyltransferase family protein [Xanthomonadales bacterium]NNK51001.1 isoprenylcysteine carboxylmethyltransferase family protein [Xanthomonadales bacterium]
MGSSRTEKMGNRTGLAGFIDRLRYHEASRQGLGLLLLLVCAYFTVPAGEPRIFVGFALAVVGQVWRIYAAGVIHKNRQLASTGAYSLVRHPLYLGNFLILVGFAIAGGNLIVLAVVALFFLFYYPAAIRYEDHKLETIFGDEWRNWSRNIPGMFPTGLKWQSNPDSEWSARQSLLRNGELVYTIFEIGAAILLWYRAAG